MRDWINENKNGLMVGVLTAALAAGLLLASGCSLGDLVKVDVPTGVRQSLAVPSQISLNESVYTWDSWVHYVETNTAQFQASIDESNFIWGMLSSAVNVGAESAQGPLSALPGGAFLLTGLSLVTGLFLNKPGATKALAKEKEKSYNAGMDAAIKVSNTSATSAS